MKARFGFCVLASFLLAHVGYASALTVRSADIVDGDVKNVDLGTNSVTTDKILNGTISNADLAPGAVTDSSISGTISATKISSTGLNADTVDGKHAADLAAAVHSHGTADIVGLQSALDAKSDIAHNHDVAYQKKYANVVVVAKGGGDFTDPLAAVNSITNASSDNPYLVKIAPGKYDIGAQVINLPSFVDIEGSGEDTTSIVGSGMQVIVKKRGRATSPILSDQGRRCAERPWFLMRAGAVEREYREALPLSPVSSAASLNPGVCSIRSRTAIRLSRLGVPRCASIPRMWWRTATSASFWWAEGGAPKSSSASEQPRRSPQGRWP